MTNQNLYHYLLLAITTLEQKSNCQKAEP